MKANEKWPYTNGPWRVKEQIIKAEDISLAFMGDEHDNRLSPEETNANARLVAAAPDLFEALCKLVRDADCDHNREPSDSFRDVDVRNIEVARAAIAKAEFRGQAPLRARRPRQK